MISDEYKNKVTKGKSHWLGRESDVERFVEILKKEKGEIDGLRVLDAGCAQGRGTKEIFNNNLDVFGIDVNKDFIKEAQENNPEIQFNIGKIEKLPYENEKFDAVYCVNTLFYTNPKESLSELERVLRFGGIAFITLDEKIIDLDKNKEVYSQDIDEALKEFKKCKIVEKLYRERKDEKPFMHKHFLYEIVLQKTE